MRFIFYIIVFVIFFIGGALHGAAQQKSDSVRNSSAVSLDDTIERAKIVPRVDHHQHIVGPRAVIHFPPLPPTVNLPPELSRVIETRNRIMGTNEIGDLYTDSARILDAWSESQPWVSGREAIGRTVAFYEAGTRFFPHSLAADGSVAYVTGIAVTAGSPETRMNFALGLRKDQSGVWRIESEQATPIPLTPFATPLTADQLIQNMNETGIRRAVVLSVAYFFGSPLRTWAGDEYTNVREENDWVAAQVARYPDRLVAFCGVNPLKDYADKEVRRCARELKMKGVKMHFRSSRIDILNPAHLAKLKQIFQTANELGLAIVAHINVRPYGRQQAEAFLKELLPMAPDVVVQIAHLWGGNEFVPEALSVFADAVAARDPRTKNLYFDLTEIEPAAAIMQNPEKTMQEIVGYIRRIGLKRIFYGSDAAAVPEAPPTSLRWARLRARLPLSNQELQVIADNIAPYLR